MTESLTSPVCIGTEYVVGSIAAMKSIIAIFNCYVTGMFVGIPFLLVIMKIFYQSHNKIRYSL